MELDILTVNGKGIAIVRSAQVLITDVRSALDFIAMVEYQTGCSRIIIKKEAIIEEFFDLSTKIAGDILQKFVNYRVKMAIVGDFKIYSSNSLRDFIYESNRGREIFFQPDEEQAVRKLSID